MPEKDFHTNFRDIASISLLIAVLDKSFPLFRREDGQEIVDGGGKGDRTKVLQILKSFSTSFPQQPVDEKCQ